MGSIFVFKKRSTDWWVFTLLPPGLIIGIGLLLIFLGLAAKAGWTAFFVSLGQQFFSYDVVLGSSDLSLRYRRDKKEKDEDEDVPPRILVGPTLSMVFVSAVLLGAISVFEVKLWWQAVILLFVGIVVSFLLVKGYNNNPESSDLTSEEIAQARKENEEDAKKLFESASMPSDDGIKL